MAKCFGITFFGTYGVNVGLMKMQGVFPKSIHNRGMGDLRFFASIFDTAPSDFLSCLRVRYFVYFVLLTNFRGHKKEPLQALFSLCHHEIYFNSRRYLWSATYLASAVQTADDPSFVLRRELPSSCPLGRKRVLSAGEYRFSPPAAAAKCVMAFLPPP